MCFVDKNILYKRGTLMKAQAEILQLGEGALSQLQENDEVTKDLNISQRDFLEFDNMYSGTGRLIEPD